MRCRYIRRSRHTALSDIGGMPSAIARLRLCIPTRRHRLCMGRWSRPVSVSYQSHDNQSHSVDHGCIVRSFAGLQLGEHVTCPFYGTGKELHEEEHVYHEVGQALFRFFFLPIDFCQVRNGLESIERDSQRKKDVAVCKPVGIPECQPAHDQKTHT